MDFFIQKARNYIVYALVFIPFSNTYSENFIKHVLSVLTSPQLFSGLLTHIPYAHNFLPLPCYPHPSSPLCASHMFLGMLSSTGVWQGKALITATNPLFWQLSPAKSSLTASKGCFQPFEMQVVKLHHREKKIQDTEAH